MTEHIHNHHNGHHRPQRSHERPDRPHDVRAEVVRLETWNLHPDDGANRLARRNDSLAQRRTQDRLRAVDASLSIRGDDVVRLSWLWPGRIPMRKVSLITGEEGDGKSLVAADFIARVTTGRPIPDGSMDQIDAPVYEPRDVLHVGPAADARDFVAPRLLAAGADLSRVRFLTSVAWTDSETGDRRTDDFTLPFDGPILERLLARQQPRLVVIDRLSEMLKLPQKPGLREAALHDVLAGLQSLAEQHRLAVVCVEADHPGGLVDTGSAGRRREHYDPAFKTVWGVARDPRDRSRRLFLPVRHHLGNDRAGLRFAIAINQRDVARIEWNRRDDSLTYAEATGRERVGRGIRSFSQSCRVEAWLREYLSDGEKLSVEIFHEALERGFTEHQVRNALRRVADKSKQGFQGQWAWTLKGT